jgi:hypothetical protein
MAIKGIRVLLARRPSTAQSPAFGHVDVSKDGLRQLAQIASNSAAWVSSREQVEFHPEDLAEENEVLVAPLEGFDEHYQPQASWSLQRLVVEIRRKGIPAKLDRAEISGGGWSFYAIRIVEDGKDVVHIRRRSPTHGLDPNSKIFARIVGQELKPVSEPLLSFDHQGDLLVVDQQVFVINPRQVENMLVDADAIKKRAAENAGRFDTAVAASLSPKTKMAIERVCSHDVYSARRVERMVRDGRLARVSAAKVRDALPDAHHDRDDFGKTGPLQAESDDRAKVLIEIAADLYYQPRFEKPSRRVAAYRTLS